MRAVAHAAIAGQLLVLLPNAARAATGAQTLPSASNELAEVGRAATAAVSGLGRSGTGLVFRAKEVALWPSILAKSAFGELLAHTGNDPQPYAFTGEPYDPNIGWQYHRARWMDPSVGRFAGMDPFAESDQHLYAYAASDPLRKTDATGLFALATMSVGMSMMNTLNAMAMPSLAALKASAIGNCGPEIHDNLKQALQDFDVRWETYSVWEKLRRLAAVFVPNANVTGSWDIDQLARVRSWLSADCPGCPSGMCSPEQAVSVDGNCFVAADVYYVLLGHLAELGQRIDPIHFGYDTVEKYIYGRKAILGKRARKDTLAWGRAGFNGWPHSAHPKSSEAWLQQATVTGCKAKPTPAWTVTVSEPGWPF